MFEINHVLNTQPVLSCLGIDRAVFERKVHASDLILGVDNGVSLTFFRALKTFRLTFLRKPNKCKITNVQRNNKAFSV